MDQAALGVVDVAGPHIPLDGLHALLRHQIGALVVRDFYGEQARRCVVDKVESMVRLKSDRVVNWMVSQDQGQLKQTQVDTVGVPLNVAKVQGWEREYYEQSVDQTRLFRFGDVMSPMDKLRLELDEIHSGGCQLARHNGQAQVAGLIRIMKRNRAGGAHGQAHMDDVDVLSPETGEFSANVYLQNSQSGGEVEIWPVSFHTKEELLEYPVELGLLTTASTQRENQELLRKFVLPRRSLVIKPNEGDLVMLCVQRPHSVREPIHGPRLRISAQCFISHQGLDAPLLVSV